MAGDLCDFSIISTLLLATTLFAEYNDVVDNKHLAIFFYKEQDGGTQTQEKVFDDAMQKKGSSIKFIKVNVKDPTQQALVNKYNLKRTPMPFVLY